MKTCTRCQESKPLSSFRKNKLKPGGLAVHCKQCASELTIEWRKRNKERIKEKDRIYMSSNPYAKKNKYQRDRANPKYTANNRHKSSIYRARKIESTPTWLTSNDVAEIKSKHTLASFFTWLSGGYVQYHVDHIVPLNSKLVCGLHVPWNLRVLRRDMNQKKHNKLEF